MQDPDRPVHPPKQRLVHSGCSERTCWMKGTWLLLLTSHWSSASTNPVAVSRKVPFASHLPPASDGRALYVFKLLLLWQIHLASQQKGRLLASFKMLAIPLNLWNHEPIISSSHKGQSLVCRKEVPLACVREAFPFCLFYPEASVSEVRIWYLLEKLLSMFSKMSSCFGFSFHP